MSYNSKEGEMLLKKQRSKGTRSRGEKNDTVKKQGGEAGAQKEEVTGTKGYQEEKSKPMPGWESRRIRQEI